MKLMSCVRVSELSCYRKSEMWSEESLLCWTKEGRLGDLHKVLSERELRL